MDTSRLEPRAMTLVYLLDKLQEDDAPPSTFLANLASQPHFDHQLDVFDHF
jgi:hypothetical protein